jgi:hypothetical protein
MQAAAQETGLARQRHPELLHHRTVWGDARDYAGIPRAGKELARRKSAKTVTGRGDLDLVGESTDRGKLGTGAVRGDQFEVVR